MENDKYRIVLMGKVTKDSDLVQVKKKLAQLFKKDVVAIEQLFKKPSVIKTNLSNDEALKYKTALEKIGAECLITKMPIVSPIIPSSVSKPFTSSVPLKQPFYKFFLHKNIIFASFGLTLLLFVGYFFSDRIIEEDGYNQNNVVENLRKTVTSNYIDQNIKQMLIKNNLDDALMYKNLATYLNIQLEPTTQREIDSKNNTLLKSAWNYTKDLGKDFVINKANNEGNFAGTVVSNLISLSDLSPIDDLQDFYSQAKNHLTGKEIDSFIYTLSMISMASSFSAVTSTAVMAGAPVAGLWVTGVTGGLAKPVAAAATSMAISKGKEVQTTSLQTGIGISILKTAKKTGNLSTKLLNEVSKVLNETIDLDTFKNNLKNIKLSEVARVKEEVVKLFKTINTDKVIDVLSDIKKISDNTSTIDAIKIIKYADNLNELKRLKDLSGDFKSNTRGILVVLEKQAIKITTYTPKNIYLFIIAFITLLFALTTNFFRWSEK